MSPKAMYICCRYAMLFHTRLHSESVKDTNKMLILLCSKVLSQHCSTTNWNLITGLVPSRLLGCIELLTTPMQCRILFIFTFPHNSCSTLSPPFFYFLTTLEEFQKKSPLPTIARPKVIQIQVQLSYVPTSSHRFCTSNKKFHANFSTNISCPKDTQDRFLVFFNSH